MSGVAEAVERLSDAVTNGQLLASTGAEDLLNAAADELVELRRRLAELEAEPTEEVRAAERSKYDSDRLPVTAKPTADGSLRIYVADQPVLTLRVRDADGLEVMAAPSSCTVLRIIPRDVGSFYVERVRL